MKTCSACGKELTRRKKEALSQFEARACCSKSCALRHRQPHRPDITSRYRQVKVDGVRKLEHRHVMEVHLGRPLARQEQVHHQNGDRLDNRLDNLELVTTAEHGLRHTFHPVTKTCEVCGAGFTPHKTKRARQKTCGKTCAQVLRVLRVEP